MVTTAVREASTMQGYGPVPVPVLWPGETVVCLGSGPSLAQTDVDACRGRARVIAIKDAVRLAPWADALYGAGADAGGDTWWKRYGPSLTFTGLRYCLDPKAAAWASVLVPGPAQGLTSDPGQLATGGHSGYSAINLALHLGARRIVLLGYDLQATGGQDHFFGSHQHGHSGRMLPFGLFQYHFPSIVPAIEARGVTVVNASRATALGLFPRMPITEALA